MLSNATCTATLRLIARRGKHDYLVWHHAAQRRGLVAELRKNVKWSAVLRAARYFFLVIVAAYVLWFRAMCGDDDDEVRGGDAMYVEDAAAAGSEGLLEAQAAAAAEAAAVGGATVGGRYKLHLYKLIPADPQRLKKPPGYNP